MSDLIQTELNTITQAQDDVPRARVVGQQGSQVDKGGIARRLQAWQLGLFSAKAASPMAEAGVGDVIVLAEAGGGQAGCLLLFDQLVPLGGGSTRRGMSPVMKVRTSYRAIS